MIGAFKCTGRRRWLTVLIQLHLISILCLTSALNTPSSPPSAEDIIRLSSPRHQFDASLFAHKQNPGITVLGYVTPWNSRGKELVEQFKPKFDLVSPVWYTVLVSKSSTDSAPKTTTTPATTWYKLSGAPPTPEDEEWYIRLQQPPSAVRVVPRFFLDGWEQKDYIDLLSNATLWRYLAETIVSEVTSKQYDGIVFESGATYLLYEPLRELSQQLHQHNKTLVAVLPPIRTRHSLGGGADQKLSSTEISQNQMILQSIPQLGEVVDLFSVMTYDMSGAMGRVSSITGKDFPDDSPLRQAKKGSLRQAGPNTSPQWIAENVEQLIEAAKKITKRKVVDQEEEKLQKTFDPSNPLNFDDFNAEQADQDQGEAERVAEKFLMGIPMYAYRYPLFWIDRRTGQGQPLRPATTSEEHNDLLAQSSMIPFLRGPGEALTMPNVVQILTDQDVYLARDIESGEVYFDYLEQVPLDSLAVQHGVKPGEEIYWRVFMPTQSTMLERIESVTKRNSDADSSVGQAGISLWEVGQASKMLLVDL